MSNHIEMLTRVGSQMDCMFEDLIKLPEMEHPKPGMILVDDSSRGL